MTRGLGLMRVALATAGALAAVTGTLVAARGAAAIPGGAPAAASKEGVTCFYAVWWASQGPVIWRLSRSPDLPPIQLQAVCATTFLGGLARLAAARRAGRPHPLFQALTIAELVLPPVLIIARGRGRPVAAGVFQ